MKEYSFIDIKKVYINNNFKELIYCFYWLDNEKKFDMFENKDYYFYVDSEEIKNNIHNDIIVYPEKYITVNGKECVKVEPLRNLKLEEFRYFRDRYVNTYESDIPALTRWICKNKPRYSKIVRKLYIDIETIKDSKGHYGNTDNPQGPVVLITCYDNFSGEYTVFCYKDFDYKQEKVSILRFQDEREMLLNFMIYVRNKKFDYILGWNIESYDIPYLLSRMKLLSINYNNLSIINRVYYKQTEEISSHKFSSFYINIGGLGIFDLMSASQRLWLGKKCGYSLDKMSKHYLNEGKLDVEDIDLIYKNNFDILIEYNINDVRLCILLDKKLELFSLFQSFQEIISINVNNTIIQSNNIFYYILQNTDRILLNSNKKTSKLEYEGGMVLETIPGIFKDCYKFDFVSMYPSIMLTYNISPDTILTEYDKNCINMDNKFYFKKSEGIITKVIKELYNKRIEYKNKGNKELSLAYKLIMNSIYGQFTAPYSRIYSFDCGAAITYQGRRMTKELLNNILLNIKGKIILGDTDSIVFYPEDINFKPENIIILMDKILDNIYLNDNIIINKCIRLELEKKLDKVITFQIGSNSIKKKYIEYYNNEINMVGLDCIKSDTMEIARDLQLDLVAYYLKADLINKYEVNNILEDYKEKLRNDIINKNYRYISIPAKINKKIDLYKSNVFSIKSLLNTNLKISVNERFYIIVTNIGPLSFKKISDLENFNFKVDFNYMWYRISSKTKIFLELLPSEQTLLQQFIN